METVQKEQTMNRNNQKKPPLLQEPGKLYVIRRNGDLVEYNAEKITLAVANAFLAVEGVNAQSSDRVHDKVNELVTQLTATFNRRLNNGGIIHIEDIQDQVELALMRTGEHKVARAYVLYREERRKAREAQAKRNISEGSQRLLHITLSDGLRVPLDMGRVSKIVEDACHELADVDANEILKDVERNLFDGLTIKDLQKALVLSARTLIEHEPNYTYVAARILMDELRSDALMFLAMGQQATSEEMVDLYPAYFAQYLQRGVKVERLTPDLLNFDVPRLAAALKPERDNQLTYLGLQTLYDRYFIHQDGHRFELPQAFFMRVAMGLAVNEKDKEARAIEFYNLLSSFDYMTSTPTLFNSGTLRPQLSSCYLSTIPDNLEGIYSAIKDNALLSKYAGGLGNDWTPVRAMGADIKGTNGQSLGPIPFMVVANATLVAVNQGGKRKGAGCAYLETFHRSIKEFLELRKNTGDERRRTHDMNTANWIPDLFMKRVMENGEWTLFSPDEAADLHDLYGKSFEEAYLNYEIRAKQGKMRNIETMPAVNLWRRMLGMLFETGHPWLTFKDPCNLRSPQQHAGVVHSSNLCTEITLNTSEEEIAVCNLGSINLPAHISDKGELDKAKLERTINTAMRMLDNVIDINYYSVPQARRSNLKHRPVGLGIMGFQDALYKLGIDYTSDAAVQFADRSMEQISYFAIQASTNLAEERGAYSSYEGSLWSKGILPIDSIQLLENARGKQYLEQDRSQTLDWDSLRKRIKTVGMRNSNTMAIAPTATISNIIGVSQSIEPTFQNLFVKSNLSGEFTVINPYLVNDLKKLGLWDAVMINDLKYYNGSVAHIGRVPEALKRRYATAFEIDPSWLIEAASRRQKWIDQAQSLNLYMAEPSGKKLDTLYKLAWIRGLKTTYYLRSMGASNAEKSTIHDGALNAVSSIAEASSENFDSMSAAATPNACSIDDPDCEACQ